MLQTEAPGAGSALLGLAGYASSEVDQEEGEEDGEIVEEDAPERSPVEMPRDDADIGMDATMLEKSREALLQEKELERAESSERHSGMLQELYQLKDGVPKGNILNYDPATAKQDNTIAFQEFQIAHELRYDSALSPGVSTRSKSTRSTAGPPINADEKSTSTKVDSTRRRSASKSKSPVINTTATSSRRPRNNPDTSKTTSKRTAGTGAGSSPTRDQSRPGNFRGATKAVRTMNGAGVTRKVKEEEEEAEKDHPPSESSSDTESDLTSLGESPPASPLVKKAPTPVPICPSPKRSPSPPAPEPPQSPSPERSVSVTGNTRKRRGQSLARVPSPDPDPKKRRKTTTTTGPLVPDIPAAQSHATRSSVGATNATKKGIKKPFQGRPSAVPESRTSRRKGQAAPVRVSQVPDDQEVGSLQGDVADGSSLAMPIVLDSKEEEDQDAPSPIPIHTAQEPLEPERKSKLFLRIPRPPPTYSNPAQFPIRVQPHGGSLNNFLNSYRDYYDSRGFQKDGKADILHRKAEREATFWARLERAQKNGTVLLPGAVAVVEALRSRLVELPDQEVGDYAQGRVQEEEEFGDEAPQDPDIWDQIIEDVEGVYAARRVKYQVVEIFGLEGDEETDKDGEHSTLVDHTPDCASAPLSEDNPVEHLEPTSSASHALELPSPKRQPDRGEKQSSATQVVTRENAGTPDYTCFDGAFLATQFTAEIKAGYEAIERKRELLASQETMRLERLAKDTMRSVIAEWKEVVLHIRHQEGLVLKEKATRRRQKQINNVLDQSNMILSSQQTQLQKRGRGRPRKKPVVSFHTPSPQESDTEPPGPDQVIVGCDDTVEEAFLDHTGPGDDDDDDGESSRGGETEEHEDDEEGEQEESSEDDGSDGDGLHHLLENDALDMLASARQETNDEHNLDLEVTPAHLEHTTRQRSPPYAIPQDLSMDTFDIAPVDSTDDDFEKLFRPTLEPYSADSQDHAPVIEPPEVSVHDNRGASSSTGSSRILPPGTGRDANATIEHPGAGTSMDVDPNQNDEYYVEDSGSVKKGANHLQAYAVAADVDFNPDARIEKPLLLRGSLRPYQQSGLEWLASLHRNRVNGILADEMGLGKTIQTIALLAHLACDRGIWGPHLIVVPTSVLRNWEMEFKKFLPGFRVISYYGDPKRRKELRRGWRDKYSFNVCITSYTLAIKDARVMKLKAWYYMILDEAHMIKNFKSQRWQGLLLFRSFRRLLLTGTPLQNNLTELWALLQFLKVGSDFVGRKEFEELLSGPIERAIESGAPLKDQEHQLVSQIHTLLRPYLLRRLKRDVEKEMPSKVEHLVQCPLSKRQRFLYDEFMSKAETQESLQSGAYQKIANILMQLRKVCNHPDLFETRAIRTSFAMESSVIAAYEIQDLLVRRRWLLEQNSDETANLDFLGLKFVRAEEKPLLAAVGTRILDASHRIHSMAKFPQTEPPQPDLRTIAGYRRCQQHHSAMHQALGRVHLSYVNSVKCRRLPIFGSELLATLRTCTKPLLPSTALDCRRSYLQTPETASSMILSYESREQQMAEIIERFAFATPNVVAPDVAEIVLRPCHRLLAKQSLTFTRVLHRAAKKLQIEFPDPSLLQYDCGKLQKLAELLRERKAGKHRVLIFTQMTRVLDILEQFLNFHGHRYLRLDGTTKTEDRQYITERFNADDNILCFISSSRSGGVGINLTGADTVIFYDSDFNPQMDRQCEDRAHRIGQTRDVHIYRFVSQHTVEEAMQLRASQKRLLDTLVIQKGAFDWRDLFGSHGEEQGSATAETGQDIFGDDSRAAIVRAMGEYDEEEDRTAAERAEKEERERMGWDGEDLGTVMEFDTQAGVGAGEGVERDMDGQRGDSNGDAQVEVSPSDANEQSEDAPQEKAPDPEQEEGVLEDEPPATTQDYMLAFIQRDREFFLDPDNTLYSW